MEGKGKELQGNRCMDPMGHMTAIKIVPLTLWYRVGISKIVEK